MRKAMIGMVVLLVILLGTGCNQVIKGGKPPAVFVEVDNAKYDTVLGSYCWKYECVDTAGSHELVEDKEPISVQAGEVITLNMDYTPKPNEEYVGQIQGDKEKEVDVQDNQFIAPEEKGTYVFVYSVWWTDEEKDNYSHGDAYYAFSIQVE